MNFFRGEENAIAYFFENELDLGTTFLLDLQKVFEVGLKIFTVKEIFNKDFFDKRRNSNFF